MFSKMKITQSTSDYLKQLISEADAIVIGAGSGLSTSAGIAYSGKRFENNFADFIEKYHFKDMYYATFYRYETLEEYWAYMSRHIYWNRYFEAAKEVYINLLDVVKDKDYFVITTNVDHQFQKAGIDKKRLYYMQGDYGLFQCSVPCHNKTYDNEEAILKMVSLQKEMKIPTELIPHCPKCNKPMAVNLRYDSTFVQDKGWENANLRYEKFIQDHKNSKILFLELGVGGNTPAIIKYPFWRMTAKNSKAFYVCINKGESIIPKEIEQQSLSVDADIKEVIEKLI